MPTWKHSRTDSGQQLHALVGGIDVRIAKEGSFWTAYLDDAPHADCDTVDEAKSAALDACIEILAEQTLNETAREIQ